MSDEGTEQSHGEDAFEEALLLDAQGRRIMRIVLLLLAVALFVSTGVLGTTVIVRGNSIREGEQERAALRATIEAQDRRGAEERAALTRSVEVLTDEVLAIRADVDARRVTDVCVNGLTFAVADASAAALAYITDPLRTGPDPAALGAINAQIEAARKARNNAAEQCNVTSTP